jgi:hypothetical protein
MMPIKGVDDEKLSQELKELLAKTLPAAQLQLLKDGKVLEIALDTLPDAARELAEKYVKVRWSRGWGYLQDVLKLDRKVGLYLWISPGSFELTNVNGRLPNRRAQQLVGINGMLTDGRSVFF